MLILKCNMFAINVMTTAFVTITLPALAQASVEQQQLLQGIAMVSTISERVILGMLILIAVSATLRSLMPPPDEEPKYPWFEMSVTFALGLMAAMIASIIGQWTHLIKSNVLISLVIVTGLMLGTYIGKRIYKKNLQEEKELFTKNYKAFIENLEESN